jgi:threonine synthase
MMQRDWHVPDHVVVPGGNMGNSSALGKGFAEMKSMGLIDHVPKLSIVQAEGAAPLAQLFSKLGQSNRAPEIETVSNPKTLASAIKIGAPISWKKALRTVLHSGGNVISVTEQELADAKAMIGREGIGCEPASAATVAGIKKLTAAGKIGKNESVVAVLTGNVLKDPDYVAHYHRGTLSLETEAKIDGAGFQPISGALRNAPRRVAATKDAIIDSLERVH